MLVAHIVDTFRGDCIKFTHLFRWEGMDWGVCGVLLMREKCFDHPFQQFSGDSVQILSGYSKKVVCAVDAVHYAAGP